MLDEHLGYAADPQRLRLFGAAIASTVKPGDQVADVGCGSGVLGLLSLKAGAARIHAIDPTAMIDVARQTFSRAGHGDRIACIQGRSQNVELSQRVDVVICDHVGYFGFDYGIVRLLQDARTRFLKVGGALIPSRLLLQLAAVESESCQAIVDAWCAQEVPAEFHWLREYQVNTKHRVNLRPDELLCAPVDLGAIDLRQDNPDFFSWTVDLIMARSGTLHGLGGWFECELAAGIWMTNSPLSAQAINRPQVFLPLDEPVPVRAGDRVRASIMARPDDHLIAWVVGVPRAQKKFVHSSLQGMLLAPEDLVRSSPFRVPRPSAEGIARTTVLAYCDGVRTVQDIEQAVLRDHPALFPSPAEISRFVVQVLGRDTV